MQTNANERIGFHYFPDTTHYRADDLTLWLPRLKKLGAHWITLISSPHRAIPENFIRSLLDENIKTVVHIPIDLKKPFDDHSLHLLIETYAKWNVPYLALFDRPNKRHFWKPDDWSRNNLVERFLDRYLPLAQAVNQSGIAPVFPPLEPGGDFWDTVFLNMALQGIQRRGFEGLFEKLVLSAYAWKYNHTLEWGSGGPDQWPATQPYFTPKGSEDQVGFQIFDWYQAQALSVVQKRLPIILIGAGCRMQDCTTEAFPQGDPNLHKENNLALVQYLENDDASITGKKLIPDDVIACNFWLLGSSENNPELADAWYPQCGQPLPIVEVLYQRNTIASPNETKHYILLSESSWESRDWVYQTFTSWMNRKDLRFGCSVEEALHANRVTIVGQEKWIDDCQLRQLISGECMIEEIYGDGMLLASKLTNL